MKPLERFLRRPSSPITFLCSLAAATARQHHLSPRLQPPTEILRTIARARRSYHSALHNRPARSGPSVRIRPRQRQPRRQQYSNSSGSRDPSKTTQPYNPTPNLNSPAPTPPSLSLSQRLRKLSREYGWSAFGVYFLLTALDFPFCFAAVRYIGADRVGHYEHIVAGWVGEWVPEGVKEVVRRVGKGVRGLIASRGKNEGQGEGEAEVEKYAVVTGQMGGYDHGVGDAERRNESENASMFLPLFSFPTSLLYFLSHCSSRP